MTTQSLSERMAAIARELQQQHDVQATLDHAVRLAVGNLPGADAAAISVVHRGKRVETEASTHEMASRADDLQYETGEGPCLDAIWNEQTTFSPSLAYDRRWPKWGPRVVEETGFQSVLAFQLFTTEHSLGALNLYSRAKDGFGDIDREEGLAIAAHLAIAMAGAREISDLGHAVDSRTLIGQATGILMERYGIDATRAFGLLVRLSMSENVKLRDVAADVAGGGAVPTPGA